MLLPIHIAAGGLAIGLGAVALLVKKGGTIHRRSGLLFVYAMLVMGTSASILGLRNGPTDGNVMAGLLTLYFVGTALTTVRPAAPWTRRINAAALTFALGLALAAIVGGVKAINSPRVSPGGVPFRTIGAMSFILATVLLLAAAEPYGDISVNLPEFPKQFTGKSIRDKFVVGEDLDAVSRATITVRAAAREIRESSRIVARALLTPDAVR